MKKIFSILAFTFITTVVSAQYKMDSDGKTIRNSNNSAVLKIDGNTIRNSSNSSIAKMSDVTNDIKGAKEEAIYVALWWFLVKGNK